MLYDNRSILQTLGSAVHQTDIRQRQGICALQAGDIKADLRGIGAPLVMGIDAANLAEIMFGPKRPR